MKKNDRSAEFVDIIWQWFSVHKRELPWRDLLLKDESERAYQILVSEVMLQQTQVSRVKIVFKDFLLRFPRIQNLADASNKEVLVAWRGMGYNSRALRLRDAARVISTDFEGAFPTEMQDLLSIKGVGHYTAAAVRNFAFQIPTACIDTNIRRILHRTFVGPENRDGTWKKNDQVLLKIADDVLNRAIQYPSRTCADWHAALMDYGSLVCTRRNPKWEICPLTKKGICKAAYKVTLDKIQKKKEPGREMGGKYIPNRIFRGRVVEELRDEIAGLSLEDIGNRICLDWSLANHKQWLKKLLQDLERDQLISAEGSRFTLLH